MTRHARTWLLTTSVTSLLALGLYAWPAQGDLISSAKKDLHKGEKAVDKEASKDTQAVKKEANKDTHAAENEANKDLGKAKHLFSQSEINDLEAKAKRSYESDLKKADAEYKKAIDDAKSFYDEAKTAALRSALEKAYKRYDGFLKKLGANFNAVRNDQSAQPVLKRLVSAGAERRVDAQVVADMRLIGERLGLIEGKPNSIVPGSSGGAFLSSFGIGIGAHVGVAVGGTALVGIVFDCNGPDQAGPFIQPAATVGYQGGTPGYGEIVVFWQPGTVTESQGLWAGITGEGTTILAPTPNSGAPSVGMTVTGQYKVFGDKGGHIKWPSLDLSEAIPGLYVGVAGSWGATGNLSVDVAHMWAWPVSASSASKGAKGVSSGGTQ